MGIVDKLGERRVATAQRSDEVDGLLWRWGQGSEEQLIVEVAQLIIV